MSARPSTTPSQSKRTRRIKLSRYAIWCGTSMRVIIGGNPTYNTPADLRLNFERLKKVNLRVHHGLYKDETAEICHWHVPATHYLESWSDTRAYDGTVSIVQPLIEPLYEGKSAHELLAVFSDQYDKKAYEIIRDYWR